jgi:hypothetical protein
MTGVSYTSLSLSLRLMGWCMRHGNVPSRLYSVLCVATTLRLADPPKASSQWISYVARVNIRISIRNGVPRLSTLMVTFNT